MRCFCLATNEIIGKLSGETLDTVELERAKKLARVLTLARLFLNWVIHDCFVPLIVFILAAKIIDLSQVEINVLASFIIIGIIFNSINFLKEINNVK